MLGILADEKMFDCQEDFRLADEDREQIIKDSTSRLRMAADEQELEVSFKTVTSLLDEVRRDPLYPIHGRRRKARRSRS